LRAALDQGHWAYGGGRLDALVGVRGVLVETEQHYWGLLAGMLDAQRAHRHAALFAAYQGYLALAGVARTRCEVLLDGPEAGVPSIKAFQATLGDIDHAFRDPLRNVGAHLHLLRLGPGAERSLRPALEGMRETCHRLEGYRAEVGYCVREGITLADWESLGGDVVDGRIALLLPMDPEKR
jgi:hypothetical protein